MYCQLNLLKVSKVKLPIMAPHYILHYCNVISDAKTCKQHFNVLAGQIGKNYTYSWKMSYHILETDHMFCT